MVSFNTKVRQMTKMSQQKMIEMLQQEKKQIKPETCFGKGMGSYDFVTADKFGNNGWPFFSPLS